MLVGLMLPNGKTVSAPVLHWIIAIVSTMPPAQRDKVIQKVMAMVELKEGAMIATPNGGMDIGDLTT